MEVARRRREIFSGETHSYMVFYDFERPRTSVDVPRRTGRSQTSIKRKILRGSDGDGGAVAAHDRTASKYAKDKYPLK